MKITKTIALQNLTRGVLSLSRSHDFRSKGQESQKRLQGSMRQLLIKAGSQLNVAQYPEFLTWAEKLMSSLAPSVNPNIAPDYISLSNLYEISNLDWLKTLAWVEAKISHHEVTLKEFYTACQSIELQVLTGNLESAAENLLILESKYGPSIQLVEMRISISQLANGLDAQKKLAQQMRGTAKGGLIGLIIFLTSVRNESKVTLPSFREQVEARANKFKDAAFSHYLKYRLLKTSPLTQEIAASILQVEENHTIYDLAYTAHHILISLGAENEYTAKLFAMTKEIFGHQSVNAKWQQSQKQDAIDFINNKDVKVAYRKLRRDLNKEENLNINALRAIGFCKATMSYTLKETRKSLRDVYTDEIARQMLGQTKVDCDSDFFKTTLNFSCFSLSGSLMRATAAAAKPNATAWAQALMLSVTDQCLVETNNDQLNDVSIQTAGQWLLEANINFRDEFLHSFIEYCKNIKIEDLPRPLYINLLIAKSFAYAQLQKPAALSSILSDLAINHSVRFANLPQGQFYEKLDWSKIASEANLTRTAISLELFTRSESNPKLDSYMRYAIEDLLFMHRKKVPSELNYIECGVSPYEFNYFLYVVCVQKNMEILRALNGTTDLDNERKNILTYLAQNDKHNAADYNSEILTILHRSRIAQGVALIDKSRIHVDENPLINKLSIVLQEKWNRYQSLTTKTETSMADMTTVLRQVAKSDDDSEVFKVPLNEGTSLLVELVSAILDRFLNDVDHGLDRYLGHRLRHNAFSNQIRGGLSESNILTKREGEIYKHSEYWEAKLVSDSDSNKKAILNAMTTFSRDFDHAVALVNEQGLRVNRQDHTNGFFQVVITPRVMYLIEKVISIDSNLPTFVAACFRIFWQLLVPSLNLAKEYVGKTMQGQIMGLFGKLQKEVTSISSSYSNDIESTIIQARINTSLAIDQASTWFHKSSIDENMHIYSVKDAAAIVVEACASSHKGSDPLIELDALGDIDIHAPALYQLADIFWILIDNACTHSGISTNVDLKIDVKAFSADGFFLINIVNDVNLLALSPTAITNIEEIRNDIDKRRFVEKLNVEGKSGLKKLAALALRHEEGEIRFDFEGSNFFVNVKIPFLALYIPDSEAKK